MFTRSNCMLVLMFLASPSAFAMGATSAEKCVIEGKYRNSTGEMPAFAELQEDADSLLKCMRAAHLHWWTHGINGQLSSTLPQFRYSDSTIEAKGTFSGRNDPPHNSYNYCEIRVGRSVQAGEDIFSSADENFQRCISRAEDNLRYGSRVRVGINYKGLWYSMELQAAGRD